jgi:hypothetical protein
MFYQNSFGSTNKAASRAEAKKTAPLVSGGPWILRQGVPHKIFLIQFDKTISNSVNHIN